VGGLGQIDWKYEAVDAGSGSVDPALGAAPRDIPAGAPWGRLTYELVEVEGMVNLVTWPEDRAATDIGCRDLVNHIGAQPLTTGKSVLDHIVSKREEVNFTHMLGVTMDQLSHGLSDGCHVLKRLDLGLRVPVAEFLCRTPPLSSIRTWRRIVGVRRRPHGRGAQTREGPGEDEYTEKVLEMPPGVDGHAKWA